MLLLRLLLGLMLLKEAGLSAWVLAVLQCGRLLPMLPQQLGQPLRTLQDTML